MNLEIEHKLKSMNILYLIYNLFFKNPFFKALVKNPMFIHVLFIHHVKLEGKMR